MNRAMLLCCGKHPAKTESPALPCGVTPWSAGGCRVGTSPYNMTGKRRKPGKDEHRSGHDGTADPADPIETNRTEVRNGASQVGQEHEHQSSDEARQN